MPQEISGMVFKIELVGLEKPIWRRFFCAKEHQLQKVSGGYFGCDGVEGMEKT